MQLPPKGDNFKKNNSYDFFVLIPRAIPARSGWYAVTLPRAATPGNTSLCVSYANGTCFGSGWSSVFFEHYVAADVEFGRRPYFDETQGSVIITVDPALGTTPLAATITIPSGSVAAPFVAKGSVLPGRSGTIISFDFHASLPLALDVDATISVVIPSLKQTITHTRRFIRAPSPTSTNAVASGAQSIWQLDHERAGLLVDGRSFFGAGWFGAGFGHVSVGLPPSYYDDPAYVAGTNSSHDSYLQALGEASMMAEWGKQGITMVRIGAPYDAGNYDTSTGWSPQNEADALRNFRLICDAAASAGIYLIVNMPIQTWGNAMSGIPVKIAPNSTALEWEQWTLGNMSLVMKHPAIAGWYGCDDCCHPGVVDEYGPVQFYALAKIHAIMRKHDPYHLVYGTVACRVMWMWRDSYGSSGIGLDVTMAEAYGGGMDTFASLRTYPMKRGAMFNMPLPSAFAPYTLRTHSYSSLVGGGLMVNAFDMQIGQYANTRVDAEVAWWGAEASELIRSTLSSANYAGEVGKCRAANIDITSVNAREPTHLLPSRVFAEERASDAPTDSFCYSVVVAHGKSLPGQMHVEIANLELPPSATALVAIDGCNGTKAKCWPLERVFRGLYSVNLTFSPTSGNWSFDDVIGSFETNVYRLGCYVHDRNCTTVTPSKVPGGLIRPGHPFPTSHCLVDNGGFEFVALAQGAANGLQSPGHLGDLGSGWVLGFHDHGCCLGSDDRTRIVTSSTASFAGRYSLDVVIPTQKAAWVIVPINSKEPGPLENATSYRLAMQVRSKDSLPLGLHTFVLQQRTYSRSVFSPFPPLTGPLVAPPRRGIPVHRPTRD